MLRKQELLGIRNGYEKNIKIICDTVKYGKTSFLMPIGGKLMLKLK